MELREWTLGGVLLSPMLLYALLALLLGATGTDYATYFEGAQFVHFMLGPATVCLALPLYDNLPRVRRASLFYSDHLQ